MDRERLAIENYHLIDEYLRSTRSIYDDEAHMAVTDAYIRALDTYDSSKSSFSTYFYICARNARRSLGRRRQNEPTEISLDSSIIESKLSVDLHSSDLESYIDSYIEENLDGRDAEIMRLEVAGYTHREIADMYGISRQSISKRVKRIRRDLAKRR